MLARWTDPAAADGRARRRQRLDLGHARPAAPGPGRPGAAPRREGDAEPGHQHHRQRAGRLAAELPRGVDARHRRLHRDAAASGCRSATCSTTSPTPAELAKVPVEGTDGRLRLSDVADVVEDHQPLIGDAVVDDGHGLLLVVEKFPGASTLGGDRGRRGGARRAAPGPRGHADRYVPVPAGRLHRGRDRNLALACDRRRRCCCCSRSSPSSFAVAHRADRAVDHSAVAGRGGAGARPARRDVQRDARSPGWRRARRSSSTTPSSAPTNVGRRLRERREQAATVASRRSWSRPRREIRRPLVYATLIALLAIVPVAVIEGRPGAFFEPLVLAYALAVVAAMLVALTRHARAQPAAALAGRRPAARVAAGCAGSAPRYERGACSGSCARPRAGAARRRVRASLVAARARCRCWARPLIPAFKDRDVLVRARRRPRDLEPADDAASRPQREPRAARPAGRRQRRRARRTRGRPATRSSTSTPARSGSASTPDADYDDDARLDRARRGPRAAASATTSSTYTTQKIRDVGALRRRRATRSRATVSTC